MDFTKRSPGLWIGLAAASLAALTCICGLALIAVLAASRTRQMASPAPTQVSDPSGGLSTQETPPRPALNVTSLPRVDEGWPNETVPMPAKADLGTLIGSPDSFSVISDQDFKDVLAFYQNELETQGWSKVDYGTRITEGDAELHYLKDDVTLTVTLARIPFVGTLVEIRVQPA